MRIVQTRKISQFFFFCLFLWFCLVSTPGDRFFQLYGWPVNWFLQLDPLVAFSTILTTHVLYSGLVWALVTFVLTVIFGRFFCGWVCPFGTIHQSVGYLAHRNLKPRQRVGLNGFHPLQRIKYIILLILLGAAVYPSSQSFLLTGLLDPIPLVSRSVNLFVVPVADTGIGITSVKARLYQGDWLVFLIFFSAILANFFIPRLYCRFICPLGALLGFVSRLAVWRIGKMKEPCSDCKMCERFCEGGCAPSTNIRVSECVLCCNCIDPCPDKVMTYQALANPAGEDLRPNISRRGFTLSLVSGFLAAPAFGLAGKTGSNWNTAIIRPPGALDEKEFLRRCIKCGQCMRVCPTNVLQPTGLEYGLETLWTPTLNNRIGSSGCQLNCTQCSLACPTAAIRPITLNEKLGRDDFADKGPVKIGTAFLQRGRCLPWAMNKPCIVCEENCPLSPKAIFTRKTYETVRNGRFRVKAVQGPEITIAGEPLVAGVYGSGDFFCLLGDKRFGIRANGSNFFLLNKEVESPDTGAVSVEVQVRLQRPYIDIEKCIGCGICEHECPVNGKKAIRVTAEGETRNPKRALLLRRSQYSGV